MNDNVICILMAKHNKHQVEVVKERESGFIFKDIETDEIIYSNYIINLTKGE